MARYHKVLWSEGLFLTQHHFQQFDAFHEQDRSFLIRALLPFAWGASHLAIDSEAVTNRMFNLTEFEGVMPDGTTVRAPAVDDAPPPRSFDELFAPTEKVLSVYLALPRIRPGVHGVKLDGSDDHGVPTDGNRGAETISNSRAIAGDLGNLTPGVNPTMVTPEDVARAAATNDGGVGVNRN